MRLLGGTDHQAGGGRKALVWLNFLLRLVVAASRKYLCILPCVSLLALLKGWGGVTLLLLRDVEMSW